MTNQGLTCRDCGEPFTFDATERQQFAEKGHYHPPSRCATCRVVRRDRRAANPMSGPVRREPSLYSAVCAQCGKQTQVPIEPREDRPVYCRDCYASRRMSMAQR